ncbi:chaperone modulator CbpM [Dictyobacter kobayashii]|uniref:MerR family transcriptional regulator n=1 Tax=Dictyobacter kobayashii TaxID=2014872 RepID=A0A402AY66_9CHLR|nr:chaperone modulator CbpM [Dictyobacter kobayashii]GCE24014.1 hypothetical protein KDK_78140 [Dictyobacter kobayashii]
MSDSQLSSRITKIVLLGPQESYTYSEREILDFCRLEQPFVLHLAEVGLIGRLDVGSMEHNYSEKDLRLLRRAYRLQRDLDINQAGVEVVLRLLIHVDELHQALARYVSPAEAPSAEVPPEPKPAE